MTPLIRSLQWRYATKKFDPDQKVPEKDFSVLLEAARLSASSYGLQPYHILVIEDPAIRRKLREAAMDQSQVTDASHLIVFAAQADLEERHVEEYLENVSRTRGTPLQSLQGYGDRMKSSIGALPASDRLNWTEKQCYIALGNLLAAAAELRIDTCPMEGFSNDAFDEILGLAEKGLHATVMAAVGYRSPEDKTQYFEKVRQPAEELYTYI